MKIKFNGRGISFISIACALMASLPSIAIAQGTDGVDPDWPCIQAYVPEVAIAVIWPEPVEESIVTAWKKSDELKKVVRDFGGLETFSDEDRKRMEVFAESVAPEDRIDIYNKVAAGIVGQFNIRRKGYFKGIRKYTRQQIAVAEQIEVHLNELAELAESTDPESEERKQEIRDASAWQQRIFDKRERNIGLLCDLPVELESLMGEILRELAQFLP